MVGRSHAALTNTDWSALDMKIHDVMIVVTFIAGTASGIPQITSTNNTKQSASESAISLTLAANPQQVKRGESTRLDISLKNVSASAISVFREVSESDDSDYDVFVIDDKGI